MAKSMARAKKKAKNPNFGKNPSLRTDRTLINGKYKKLTK